MNDMDWERKDRRIAWMNTNTACSQIIAARIQAGLFKPKNNKEAMSELLDAINIEFSQFLTLDIGEEKPQCETVAPKEERKPEQAKWFCECGKPVSDKVKAFSEDKWGVIQCFDCQKKRREKEAQIEEALGPQDVKF